MGWESENFVWQALVKKLYDEIHYKEDERQKL